MLMIDIQELLIYPDELGTGYDQWGVLHGTWSVDSGEEVVLYLRGLRQRRWGPDQAVWLHRSVTVTAIHTSGLMFTLTASSARHGLSHVVVGHVLEPKGRQMLVDQCDLSLPDLGEDDNNIPQDIGIRFTGMCYSQS
uniref:Uncharacterized protein n=1 Tax=Timema monikensis TaxID=170555 RepID=A0A7R9HUG0_9NEOP|nr:unnamed protein product [Timema monikensis]